MVNRPRDLTREQLNEVRLLLDGAGYSEANLKAAWRKQSNQDIAAGVIGYIRQAALGEALLPFDQRVAGAMQSMFACSAWTPLQRKWLDRLAKQLHHEVVIDHASSTPPLPPTAVPSSLRHAGWPARKSARTPCRRPVAPSGLSLRS